MLRLLPSEMVAKESCTLPLLKAAKYKLLINKHLVQLFEIYEYDKQES